MSPRTACAAALVLWGSASIVPLPALAQATRLDDSGSPRAQVESRQMLSERGRPLDDAVHLESPAKYAIVRFGRVDYRLATAGYVGKSARIFYVVPAVIPGLLSPAGLKVEWRTRGLFSSGAARPGERALVWSGTVREPILQESFELTMEIRLADVRIRPGAGLSFESYFEIEVNP